MPNLAVVDLSATASWLAGHAIEGSSSRLEMVNALYEDAGPECGEIVVFPRWIRLHADDPPTNWARLYRVVAVEGSARHFETPRVYVIKTATACSTVAAEAPMMTPVYVGTNLFLLQVAASFQLPGWSDRTLFRFSAWSVINYRPSAKVPVWPLECRVDTWKFVRPTGEHTAYELAAFDVGQFARRNSQVNCYGCSYARDDEDSGSESTVGLTRDHLNHRPRPLKNVKFPAMPDRLDTIGASDEVVDHLWTLPPLQDFEARAYSLMADSDSERPPPARGQADVPLGRYLG